MYLFISDKRNCFNCLFILLKTVEFEDKFSIQFYCYYMKYLHAHDYVSKEPISAIFYKPKILPL